MHILQGTKQQRTPITADLSKREDWDVLLTNPEICCIESVFMKQVKWNYIIIDEGHTIKNEKTDFAKLIRRLHSRHRLLLTGTPVQNDLNELWSLLNFLHPEIYSDPKIFVSNYKHNSEGLHKHLKRIMLRRKKNVVETSLLPKVVIEKYVDMTSMQRKLYNRLDA